MTIVSDAEQTLVRVDLPAAERAEEAEAAAVVEGEEGAEPAEGAAAEGEAEKKE